jgi:short-subunit dehydrogenase
MNRMNLRGRWVLVTGASAGLGKAFASHLAKDHGANLVLVARRRDRLEALAGELGKSAGVETHVIAADLSKTEEVDRAIKDATSGRQLTAAVLNAGVTHFGHFHELPWADFQTMLQTNVSAVVRMTTELVPHLEKDPDGGGILIVSSMAGFTPVPFQTAYAATKAFLVHFGMGMWHELDGRNVSITTFAPAGIQTDMTAGEKFGPLRGWLAPVDEVAKEGLDALVRRRFLAIPGAQNRLGNVLFRFLPRRFLTGRMAAVYRGALGKTRGADGA